MDINDLNPQERAELHRLSTELPFFASKALKIVDKQGRMVRLLFNQAQWYIHTRLEAQKLRTGRVRAIIIKGRQ